MPDELNELGFPLRRETEPLPRVSGNVCPHCGTAHSTAAHRDACNWYAAGGAGNSSAKPEPPPPPPVHLMDYEQLEIACGGPMQPGDRVNYSPRQTTCRRCITALIARLREKLAGATANGEG